MIEIDYAILLATFLGASVTVGLNFLRGPSLPIWQHLIELWIGTLVGNYAGTTLVAYENIADRSIRAGVGFGAGIIGLFAVTLVMDVLNKGITKEAALLWLRRWIGEKTPSGE